MDGEQWAAAGRGALAGTLATVVMSGVMLAAGRAGLLGRQPPEAIVRRAGSLAGAEPQGRTADLLACLAHVGFGAVTGAAHALLPPTRRPVARAVLVSLGVYAVSYAGWVPAVGALPPPRQDRSDRQAVMAAAHAVYGAVLGALDARVRQGRR